MKIKIGTSKIAEFTQAIDGKELDGITFTYTGKKSGIYAIFEHNAQTFEEAKKAIKTFAKANDEFSSLFISITE